MRMWIVLFLWEWLHTTTEPIIRGDCCRGWCGGDRPAGEQCVVRVWVRYRNRRGWRNTGLNPFYFIFLGSLASHCYSYIYNTHHIIFLWVTKNIKRGFSTIQYNIISWSSFRLYKYCFTDFFLFFFFLGDSG